MQYSTEFCQKAVRLGDENLARHVREGSVFLVAHILRSETSWYRGLDPSTVARLLRSGSEGMLILIRTIKGFIERKPTFFELFYLTSVFTPWRIEEYIKNNKEHELLLYARHLEQEERERNDLFVLWRKEISGGKAYTLRSGRILIENTQPFPQVLEEDLVVVKETIFDEGGLHETGALEGEDTETELLSSSILAAALAQQDKIS